MFMRPETLQFNSCSVFPVSEVGETAYSAVQCSVGRLVQCKIAAAADIGGRVSSTFMASSTCSRT